MPAVAMETAAAAAVKIPCEDCEDSDVFTVDASFMVTYFAKLRLEGTNKELYDISYCKHDLLIYLSIATTLECQQILY